MIVIQDKHSCCGCEACVQVCPRQCIRFEEDIEDIFDAVCTNVPKDALVLCALGMTATVLSYGLAKEGYQAIDIDHADIEYEWFLMGDKIPIEGKNELGILNLDAPLDQKYENQIIAKVL